MPELHQAEAQMLDQRLYGSRNPYLPSSYSACQIRSGWVTYRSLSYRSLGCLGLSTVASRI